MQNILVVGGAGYIGSHFCNKFCNIYNIYVLDNLETGHRDVLNKNIIFLKGDIRDKDYLEYIFRTYTFNAVVHFAACSLVGESMVNPLKYYDNNVCGTRNLLEVMKKFNVNKILFSSSAAVYGNPNEIPIKEDSLTIPTNPYGETKLAIEKMLYWADIAYGLKYISLRYFNACGASFDGENGELHNPETHLIPLVCKVALGQKDSIDIYGNDYDTKDGSCIRDYIHVLDLANAHNKALQYLLYKNNSNIFNLGTNKGYSVFEIIKKVEEISGKKINVNIRERRIGDPAILIASSEKAFNILNWKPEIDLDNIIKTVLNWHSLNLNKF